jgi:hypothetical protein
MARKLKVDFTGVEEFVKCSEGEHIVKIDKVEEGVSEAGNDKLNVKFVVVAGASTGAVIYENYALTEKALWKLKSMLSKIGIKADKKLVLDLDAMEGKRLIVEVEHEEYNGNERARIKDYKKLEAEPVDEDEDDEEEEEETPPPVKKKAAKKKPEPEPEEEEDEDEEEDEPAPPVKKKKAAPAPAKPKKKPAPVVEDEEEDDWDDEE